MINKPKILLFDIETMANLGYTWGLYEQNVIAYEKEWYMLCYAYKWLHQKKTYVKSLPDFKSYKKDKTDAKELVQSLWNLFDEADGIIAHNGVSFDIKKVNAKFIEHGLVPPSPYKIIDTKLIAKRYFKFKSNKLDDLGNLFGLGRKIDTGGFDLWLGCAAGLPTAWNKMTKYNIQDVILLEKVYLKMLPYCTTHPNYNVYTGTTHNCPNCNSTKVQKRGFGVNKTTKVQRFQCQDCGSWHQSALKEGSLVK